MEYYYQPLLNKYGVVRVLTYEGWSLFVGDGAIAKEVFSNPDIYCKPDFKNARLSSNLKRFFGLNQALSANGLEWKRQRKIINPIFNQTWSTELFGNCVKDLIEEWDKEEGTEVKISDKIQRMTLDVFGKAIFNIEFKSVKNANSKLYTLYTDIFEQLFSNPVYLFFPFLEHTPFFKRPKLTKDLDEYHEFIEEMINVKKEELKNGTLNSSKDLISALIHSNENSQEYKLTMEEIRDNLNLFIIAGHDTTSNTLMSTLYYLARYPEIQNELRSQVLTAMGSPKHVQ
ncbi:cytochrome P450, partial [Conidiobolus coronatus NRRL 28638]